MTTLVLKHVGCISPAVEYLVALPASGHRGDTSGSYAPDLSRRDGRGSRYLPFGFIGCYGVMALVRVFVDRSVPWIWSLLIGIVGILAGLVVLRHPLLAALTVPTTIVIILGVQGLIMGVLDMIGGIPGRWRPVIPARHHQHRDRGPVAGIAVDRSAFASAGLRCIAADPGRRACHPGIPRPRRIATFAAGEATLLRGVVPGRYSTRGVQLITRFNLRQCDMKKLIHPPSDLLLRNALRYQVLR